MNFVHQTGNQFLMHAGDMQWLCGREQLHEVHILGPWLETYAMLNNVLEQDSDTCMLSRVLFDK